MSVNWEPIDEAARHLTRPTPNWFDEPSIGQRFLGTVIDGLLLAPLMVAVFVWEGIAVSLAVTAIRAAYEILLVTHTGQTVGKMAMRTRVVDATTGDLIDLRRSAIRWFGLNGLVFVTLATGLSTVETIYTFVVCLMVLRPPLHEGPHDRLAKTLVTRAPRG